MRLLATITLAASFAVAQNVVLDPIVVSATNSKEKLQNITSNVVVITKEELEDKHIDTVAEALSEAQGVIVTQSGGVGQQASVFLRGFDSDSTIVMIDGVKINNPTLIGGQANIGNLIFGDIERIEVIKGPQSGVYGANAVAGVINIITQKATNKCQANINLEYGKYKTKKSQISLYKKINNLSAYVSYSYLKTDGFSAQADIDKSLSSYEDDAYENKTYNTKVTYDIGKYDKLNIQFMKIDTKTDYDQSIFMQDGYRLTQEDKIFSSSYIHNYSKNSYSKIYYSKTDFLTDDPKGWTKEFKGQNKEFGIDNKVKFSDNNELLFGLNREISKDKINNKELKSTGVYVTSIFKYSNVIFNTTLRRDFYSNFKDKTTGKIGAKYNFDNGLTLSANYGTAYRVPSLFEYSLNKNLKPETTKSYDISLGYKNFNITYFNNKIDDEIIFDNATFSYVNGSKKSTIKGYELGYKNAITKDLFLSVDYTRYIAKDKDGKQLLRRPKFIANLGLDYYGFKNTHINFNAQYIGKRDDISFDPITFTSKRVTLGGVFVANASVDYKVNKNLSLYAKINNIFDKKYQMVKGYATSGRAVYVGLNAKF